MRAMAPAYNHIEIQATYCIAQPKRRPNQRVQPTPLAASEIVAILKDGFVSKLVSIYEAARLTRKTLGRDCAVLCYNASEVKPLEEPL